MSRFSEREEAERYRDRFRAGRRRRIHEGEVRSLEAALARMGGRFRTIVDVGSGAGRFSTVLRAHAERLVEVDYSQHMLELNREEHAPACGSLGYLRADGRRLPLADNCADVVFCHRLLNHLSEAEDRSAVLGDLRRISAKYVLISCLMAPLPVVLIRRSLAALRGRRTSASAVATSLLLGEAVEAGLKPVDGIPIRRFFAPSAFHILAKN